MRSPLGVSSVRPRNSPATIRTACLSMLGFGFRFAVYSRLRFGLRRWRRRAHGGVEVGTGFLGQLEAELVAQDPPANLADLARREVADLERAVGNADQAIGVEAEM